MNEQVFGQLMDSMVLMDHFHLVFTKFTVVVRDDFRLYQLI